MRVARSTVTTGKQVVQPPDGRLRRSQAVTTFGPGAMVDFPDASVIVGGLDTWKYDAEVPVIEGSQRGHVQSLGSGDFRKLWITRINAAARLNDMTYNRFMQGLKLAGIELDRRVLAELAVNEPAAFAALVETSRAAVAAVPNQTGTAAA